jgi:hypothetical protein
VSITHGPTRNALLVVVTCLASSCSANLTPVVLASGLGFAGDIAVGADAVYWWDVDYNGDGSVCPNNTQVSVMKVPINGGTTTTLASETLANDVAYTPFGSIALDSANVYWTWDAVMRVPLGGGAATTLASGPWPSGIAVNSGAVYWGESGDIETMSLSSPGGTVTTLVKGRAYEAIRGIAIDAASVYWTTEMQPPTIEPHPCGQGDVMKVSLGGGPVTTLALMQTCPLSVAVDATNVYWYTQGAISKVPVGGGDTVTLVSGSAGAFAVDGTSVYWAGAGGSIKKVPIDGGATVTLTIVPTGDQVSDIAVDAANVYWTSSTNDGGKVSKLPK